MHFCLICNNKTDENVLSNNYIYYKCNYCKTSQILPQPSTTTLTEYYKKFHLDSSKGGNYDWIEERMIVDFDVKLKFIKSLTNSSKPKLLDVGCGKGFFIKKAGSFGFDAYGIDVSESGINYAKDILKVNAELKSIEEAAKNPLYIDRFDVITLLATIEHIPDPISLLLSINKCLKKEGLLFLDTGLGDVKIEKFLTGHSQWYDALQHLFVYSEAGLRILLEKTGFEIISIDRNFERSKIRRIIRYLRHFYLCFISYLFLRPILGKSGFISMQKESKWPIGKLIQIVAKKI